MAQIDRITFDPSVMGGKPCIRGQRVTVGIRIVVAAMKQYEMDVANGSLVVVDESKSGVRVLPF